MGMGSWVHGLAGTNPYPYPWIPIPTTLMIDNNLELESEELVLLFQQGFDYCKGLMFECSVVLLSVTQLLGHTVTQKTVPMFACFSLNVMVPNNP